MRNFSFEIQPEAKFSKPNLGERLNSLFFAPKIMTNRALRITSPRFEERSPKEGHARTSTVKEPIGDLRNRAAATNGSRRELLSALPPRPAVDLKTKEALSLAAHADQEKGPIAPSDDQNLHYYKCYCIVPTQLQSGCWVARIERIDGSAFIVNGIQHSSWTTSPYLATFLAVTDAEIEIDEIAACTP